MSELLVLGALLGGVPWGIILAPNDNEGSAPGLCIQLAGLALVLYLWLSAGWRGTDAIIVGIIIVVFAVLIVLDKRPEL